MKENIIIKVGDAALDAKPITISLNIRRTVDGNIMIRDHKDIDIIVDIGDKKIITFPKNSMNDGVYGAQDRFFDFLSKKGVISRNSVMAGDVYASMEAEYLESNEENIDTTQVIVYTISNWINEEKPLSDMQEYYEQEWIDNLTRPDEEESTKLGKVPHAEKKGSNDVAQTRQIFAGYSYE